MMRTRFCSMLASVAVIAAAANPAPLAAEPATWELWSSCDELPDFTEVEFLPIFLEGEPFAFVDLGGETRRKHGLEHYALQFTRDKTFELEVPVGKWLFGLLGDEWPADTVDVLEELRAIRLVRLEVDGEVVNVRPSCVVDLSSEEGALALYSVLPRFLEPGSHHLRFVWRQVKDFFFTYPYDVIGLEDPYPDYEGRRVFPRGEHVGEDLDGDLILHYELTVVD